MEEKKEEGFRAKLGRKLSKRASARTPEAPKPSKPFGSKYNTLPPNMDPGEIMRAMEDQPQASASPGFFSKMKRKLRLGSSKGKYDLRGSTTGRKPNWLRRRSDESHMHGTRDGEEDSTPTSEPGATSSKKPSSAKIQRKTKTDKEEVILIRKDQRVSVICKTEDGGTEVIFSNVESSDVESVNVDYGLDEDPYATINTVRDDVNRGQEQMPRRQIHSPSLLFTPDDSNINATNSPSSPGSMACEATTSKSPRSPADYPYARINSLRGKKIDEVGVEHNDVHVRGATALTSSSGPRITSLSSEPDYECLDDVLQRKSQFGEPEGVQAGASNYAESADGGGIVRKSTECNGELKSAPRLLDDLDPDYETLDEVRHKQRVLSLHIPISASNKRQQRDSDYARPNSYVCNSGSSNKPSPDSQNGHQPCDTKPRDSSTQQSHLSDSDNLEEDAIYDNPKVIMRKQQQQQQNSLSSPTRVRDFVASPHHHVKTPAEEELVEKLSSLLAPPLPLRNYTREEVYQSPSAVGVGRLSPSLQQTEDKPGEGGGWRRTTRHSWTYHPGRSGASEFLDAAARTASLSPLSGQRWRGNSSEADPTRRHSAYILSSNRLSPVGRIKDKESKRQESKSPVAVEKESSESEPSEKPMKDCSETLPSFQDSSEECSRWGQDDVLSKQASDLRQTSTAKVEMEDQSEAEASISPRLCHDIEHTEDLRLKHFDEPNKVAKECEKSVIENSLTHEDVEKFCNELACQLVTEALRYSKENHEVDKKDETLETCITAHGECGEKSNASLCDTVGLCDSPCKVKELLRQYAQNTIALEQGPVTITNSEFSSSACEGNKSCSEHDSEADVHKAQGARPKIIPLKFSASKREVVASQDFQDDSEASRGRGDDVGPSRRRRGETEDESSLWNDALSPSFFDLDFNDILQNKNGLCGTNHGINHKLTNCCGKVPSLGSEETFLDADFQDFEPGGREGQEANRDTSPTVDKVVTGCNVFRQGLPVICTNLRLLENVISGCLKGLSGLDKNYLANGVFKCGRFYPYHLSHHRLAVERKLKRYLHIKNSELTLVQRANSDQACESRKLQQLQQDQLHAKICDQLVEVQDMPTFYEVRMTLLGTNDLGTLEREITGNYDNPVETMVSVNVSPQEITSQSDRCEQRLSEEGGQQAFVVEQKREHERGLANGCSQQSRENGSEKSLNGISVTPEGGVNTPELCNDFHQRDISIDVDEDEEDVRESPSPECGPIPCAEPVKCLDTLLDDFLGLCNHHVQCKRCGQTDDSDEDEEFATLDVYTRTVGAAHSRAMYGELAYTSHLRPHVTNVSWMCSDGTVLNRETTDMCQGRGCHLSWKDWVTLDSHMRKLMLYTSPRLDFQHLLRTYAEFKHFVLKDRMDNPEVQGCFVMRKFAWPYFCESDPLRQSRYCCKVEELVYLKLLRDELTHFGHVLESSPAARVLFVEEREISHSLVTLLRTVVRNVNKRKRRVKICREFLPQMESSKSPTVCLTYPQQPRDGMETAPTLDRDESSDRFHEINYASFRADSIHQSLQVWHTPQDLLGGGPHCCNGDAENGQDEREDFADSMFQLQAKEWYWGPISYEQAARILHDREDGSFLVRDSSDHKYLLSLSFKSLGEIHHTRIEHSKGLFSFWSQPESHGKARICEFIDKSVQNSRDGRFLYFLRPSARGVPPLPIRLLTPVSRNYRVASLRHLSRFVVRQTVRKDHLARLPVPEKMKAYLADKQYYVEISDDDLWAFPSDGET